MKRMSGKFLLPDNMEKSDNPCAYKLIVSPIIFVLLFRGGILDKKIIVVDDEEDIQFLFEQEFFDEIEAGKIEFQFFLSADKALKYLDEIDTDNISYVISDVCMPGMDGLELLRLIKEKYPDIKVIMITASVNKENYETAEKYGALKYIVKPIDFDELKRDILND